MFSTLALFKDVRCPDSTCTRSPCPLSHTAPASTDLARLLGLTPSSTAGASSARASSIAGSSSSAGPSLSSAPSTTTKSILKRPAANAGVSAALAREVKIRKVVVPAPASSSTRPAASSSGAASTSSARPKLPPTLPGAAPGGCPTLNFKPNETTVPLKDRQRALGLLFTGFTTLYASLPGGGPPAGLVAQHAMEQEAEGYAKGGKTGYKNALSNILVALRKRSPPTSLSHPSVGIQSTHTKALEAIALAAASRLTPDSLAPFLLPLEDFETWGYMSEVPEGEGGEHPHSEGESKECGRCEVRFVVPVGGVAGMEEEEGKKGCWYHWGRKRWGKEHGVRTQLATCCQQPWNSPGCTTSRSHVFKEVAIVDLHSRSPFETTEQVRKEMVESRGLGGIGGGEAGLEVVGMDCEMFYSTCGMSVGRVTLLDDDGNVVLDEFVRPDPASVLDLNTRFSGLHPSQISTAPLTLSAVRSALCALLSPSTILIGHGLENDLLALRLVHTRVVDTAVIFPHSLGPPFRPALKDLASSHLQKIIQNSGDDGHSPEVDARTCIELVKLKVRERRASAAGGAGA